MGSTDELLKEIAELQGTGGLPVANMILLTEPLRDLLNWIIRQQAFEVAALADYLGEPAERAQLVVDALVEKGHLRGEENPASAGRRYRVVLVSKPSRMPGTFWDAVE